MPGIGAPLRVAIALGLACAWAQAAEPRIEFLPQTQARAAIIDETVEPYFQLLGAVEIGAKTGEPAPPGAPDQQRRATRQRYQTGVLEFTAPEQQAIGRTARDIGRALDGHYARFRRQPWRLIKVSDRIEGGLPHTRGDCIILGEGVVPAMRLTEGSDPGLLRREFANLLVHEQMHVLQRLNPELFADLYTRVWGFEQAGSIDTAGVGPVVVNPDGVDLNWVYPLREGDTVRYIAPRIVFAPGVEHPRMPWDFRMIAVELRRDGPAYRAAVDSAGSAKVRPLSDEKGYLADLRREPISSLYHPNEIAAEMFAGIVTVEYLSPDSQENRRDRRGILEHWGSTRDWFIAHLSSTDQ